MKNTNGSTIAFSSSHTYYRAELAHTNTSDQGEEKHSHRLDDSVFPFSSRFTQCRRQSRRAATATAANPPTAHRSSPTLHALGYRFLCLSRPAVGRSVTCFRRRRRRLPFNIFIYKIRNMNYGHRRGGQRPKSKRKAKTSNRNFSSAFCYASSCIFLFAK